MKKVKRISAILLALAICFTLAACSGGNNNSPNTQSPPESSQPAAPVAPEAKFADTVDVLLEMGIPFFDTHTPGGSGGNGEKTILRSIFDRLIGVDPDTKEFIPELAERWETSDYKTYTFYLRDDVSFHGDWGKLNAQAVIDSVQLALDSPGTGAANSWENVASMTAIDEYTVQFVLHDVNVEFYDNVAQVGASIVSVAARAADPQNGTYVGTGAYYVSDFSTNDHVTLTRNDNYWGQTPPTKTVNFRFVPEIATRAIMLQNGETDVVIAIGSEDMPQFENDSSKYKVYDFVANVCFFLGFNMVDPITGDINFRRAVVNALDLNEIALVGAGDTGVVPPDGAFWGIITEFRNTDLPAFKQDIDAAKKYLADSSYDGSEVEIMAGIPFNIAASDIIAEQLKVIGVNTKLFNTDPATVNTLTAFGNNKSQIVNHANGFNVSASYSSPPLTPTGASNRTDYNNPEVNRLFALAPTQADPAERGATYKKIQQIVYDELPLIILFFRKTPIVTSANVGGLVADPDHSHDFRFIYKTIS